MQSCVCFQHIWSFSEAAAHVRMLLLLHFLAFVSMCVCVRAHLRVYIYNRILSTSYYFIKYDLKWFDMTVFGMRYYFIPGVSQLHMMRYDYDT
jgi:hypothetical protein